MGETKTLLRIAALALMWGSSFFWIKLGLGMFSPVQLVLARLLLGAAPPAEHRLDPRHQLLERERLGDVVVSAGTEAADDVREQ